MKRFLVLSLVLVMALAGTAFAEGIQFSGEFGAEVKQNVWTWTEEGAPGWKDLDTKTGAFSFLNGDSKFDHHIKLGMGSSSDTWSLAVKLAKDTAGEGLVGLDADGGYTLKVNDDLFNLTVWQGDANSQGFVRDTFALVQGRDKGAATVRASASIMDLAKLTLQLEPGNSMIAQVTADVAGAELGLIAQRKFHDTDLPALKGATYKYDPVDNVVKVDTLAETRTTVPVQATVENALDTVALTAAYDFDVVKVTVGGGLSMNNTKELEDVPAAVKDDVEKLTGELENAFAYAVKVEAPITEEIKAEASYVVKQENWKGNGSNSAVATVKGSYEADALAVNASFTTTGKHVNTPETDDNRTTTIALDGSYDFANDITAKLAVEHKIEKDKHAAIEENINTTKITANVSAPIVEGLVSVAANVGYTFDNLGAIQVGTYVANPAGFAATTALAKRNHSAFALAKSVFDAGATFTVTPMDKLTLKPAVSFKSFKDGNKDVDESAAIRAIRNATQHTHFITNDFTAGSIITLKADATYAVGGGATITLSAGNDSYNFTAINGADATLKYNNPFASAAVKVVF